MTKKQQFRIAAILGCLTAIGPLSIDMYLASFPAIADEFGVSEGMVQLTLSSYFVGLAMGQMVVGPLSDRFGRRLPITIGMTVYALASLVAVLAPSVGVLIAVRFFQALAGCAGMVIARAIVRDLFNPRDSVRVLSYLMLVMGAAPILAPMLGGIFLEYGSWREIFVFLAAVGAVALAIYRRHLPESLPVEARQRMGWREALSTYLMLLRDRRYIGPTLASALSSGAMFAYITASPTVFISLYGVSESVFGMLLGLNACGLVGLSFANQWLVVRFDIRTMLQASLWGSVAASAVLLVIGLTGAGGLPAIGAALFAIVALRGLINPNATAIAMANHGHVAGSASALMGTLMFGLGAIAGTLVGLFEDGTAAPMVTVIFVCSILALLLNIWGLAGQARVAAE
jgi:DHA1 family bicyclomycin/chloramphenicol resistance-like MFS transporter